MPARRGRHRVAPGVEVVGPSRWVSAPEATERPHPDRVVDDPGQLRTTRLITGDEANDDRNEAQDDKHPDDPFHE